MIYKKIIQIFPSINSDEKSRNIFLIKHRLFSYYYSNIQTKLTEIEKEYLISNQKKNLKLLSVIIQLNNKFVEYNIPNIFLKGVVLSSQIYSDIGIRECRDIDLLIDEKDIQFAHKIIINQNFQLREYNKLENKTYRKYFHHVSYWNPAKKVMLELHWRPFSIESFFLEKNYSKISTKISVSNHELSVLKNEYNLIYLCIHGALHMFSELIWLLDITKFINTQDIDWNKIQQISKEWKIERPINLSIYLASYICNSTIPKEYMNPDKKTKKLFNIVLKQLPNEKRNLKFRLDKLWYFILLKKGLRFKFDNIKYRIFRTIT